MAKIWYAIFSHTGKEIEAIIAETHMEPEVILTNNLAYEGPLEVIRCSPDYINTFLTEYAESDSVVTLNGYMRILPENVINTCKAKNIRILNIHPAAIHLYPELRGKDPQERTYEGIVTGKYSDMGVVIHEVDAGVDTGKIIATKMSAVDVCFAKVDVYYILHSLGTELWVKLFKEGLLDG